MSSIMQILRRIGGAKATPTSGSAGQLALWKAGTAPTDAASLYAHDGTQWKEMLDTSAQWTVSGNDVHRVAGNVGVGAATPTHKLEVADNSANPAVQIKQAGTGAGLAVDNIVAAGTTKTVHIENIIIANDGMNGLLSSNDILVIHSPKQIALKNMSAPTQPLVIYPTGDTTIGNGAAEGRFTVVQDTAGANAMTIHCTSAAGPNYGLNIRSVAAAANTAALIRGHSNGTNLVFSVNGSGVVASTSTSIVGVSDAKHKENVRDIDVGLAEVMKLRPRRFDWKATAPASGHNLVGFVAQEVEKVMPELVTDWHPDPMGDPSATTKALKMGDMIPALVKAIQELEARIAKLEARP